ncbi:MAG: DUF1593 domain-containing protein [Alphaproteobacteria bacterium]|nr:DUF1593 domain-containing protein [Alphaproteobacteria bacterium]MDE2494047.1 DUF1593 domain-containing protein [Alphaproteobacteria bacterium]
MLKTLSVALLGMLLCAGSTLASSAERARPRVIVVTDIGNEPDDSESMVRFLVYSNEFDVEGLIATTSTWLRHAVRPEMIAERIHAYGKVLPNLRVHAKGYPSEQYLLDHLKAGKPLYGMEGIGANGADDASRLIIAAVDRPDPRPVWVIIWGGARELAQALWTVQHTRKPEAVARFVSKLRVYSISDQDDAGPWARANFPKLFWIASVHAFDQYALATWPGVSAPLPGSDQSEVSKTWIADNIQNKGPLGALYPTPEFLMEGDTGSQLYLFQNGLNSPGHPDWGGWGGRYGLIGPALGLWTDTVDAVRGTDGKTVRSNQATIWRWRDAYQNDFAARLLWSVTPNYAGANHNPELVLNGVPGIAPLELTACAGDPVSLSAKGTHDPDGNNITYHWWQYREASGVLNPQSITISNPDGEETTVTVPVAVKPAANVDIPKEVSYHVILEVRDNGTPPLTSYRRAIIMVPSIGTKDAVAHNCAR